MFTCVWPSAAQKRLSSTKDYDTYINPLAAGTDLGIEYSEDGAADATVLYPLSNGHDSTSVYRRPSDAVISLVRLGQRSIPLLIDCLGDGRVTGVLFQSAMTKPMRVPVGYVCLDVLTLIVPGNRISQQCAYDGLGACINYGFYFRPDDYHHCTADRCYLRPWVSVVQSNWRREFLQGRLRFHNPYDHIPEYKEFATPTK